MAAPDQAAPSVCDFFGEDEIGKLGIPKLGEMNFVALRLLLLARLGLGKIGGKEGGLEHGGLIGCHYGRSGGIYKVILLMRSKNMSCIRYSCAQTLRRVGFPREDGGKFALLFLRINLSL